MNDETSDVKSKTVYEAVEMEDGRTVEFAGAADSQKRRKLLKTVLIEGDEVSVRFDFRNGAVRAFTIPPALTNQFAGHGASQKIGDETAGLTDIDDMVLEVENVIDRLAKGEWNVRREGTGGGFAGTSILLRALVEVSGKSVDDIKAFLAERTQQEKIALRQSAKLKPVIDRLEAEKATKGVKIDTDALLEGLA